MHIKRKTYGTLVLLILISLICVIKQPSNNIYFNVALENKANTSFVGQLFYDLGEGYNENLSSTSFLTSEGYKIKINESWFSNAVGLRWDPLYIQKNIEVKEISLSRGNRKILYISGDKLKSHLSIGNDISDIKLVSKNKIEIVPSGNDPNCFFSNKLISDMKDALNISIIINKILKIAFLTIIIIINLITSDEKLKTRIIKIKNTISIEKKYVIILIFMFPAFLVYWRYIMGIEYYYFKDIANDTYFQTLPMMHYNAEYFKEFHKFPLWSFSSGLGHDYFLQLLDPFNMLITLLGSNAVERLPGIMQFIKVVLAGGFFYLFLRELKTSKHTSLIISLGYAFCGPSIARGTWLRYTDEAVFVALLLFAFELFYQKKNVILLPISLALLFSAFPGYYLFLYTGILLCYTLFRYASENIFSWRGIGSLYLRLLPLFMCGIAIAGIYLIPSTFSDLFVGNRISTLSFNFKNIFQNIFTLHDERTLLTSYIRTLSNSGMGNALNYQGKNNILDDPTYYCGLITLIVLPQLFKDINRKKKIWYGLAICLVVAYMISSGIVFIASAMIGYSFKISSFWIVPVILFLSAKALDNILMKNKANIYLLVITSLLTSLPAVILILLDYNGIDKKYVTLSLGFIFIYTICIMYRKIQVFNLKQVVLVFTIMEVVLFSYTIVNDRIFVTDSDLHYGYNDANTSILENLDKKEKNSFYRISKNYDSVFLSDALYQGYQGTQSYIGGTGNSKSMVDFLNNIGAPLLFGNDHYILGFNGYTELNTLFGIQYILSDCENITEYGYKKTILENENTVFENQYDLPLGYCYDEYISENDFTKMTLDEKRKIMLHACVLNDEDVKLQKFDYKKFQENVEQSKLGNILFESQNYVVGNEIDTTKSKNDVLNISFEFDNALTQYEVANLCFTYNDGTEKSIKFAIDGINHKFSFDLMNQNIKSIAIVYSENANLQIQDLKITELSAENYYSNYQDTVKNRKEDVFNITSFEQDKIKGRISLDRDKMVFFSIPYDKGWEITVDGKKQTLETVNLAFMGIELPEGDHTILLKYKPPLYTPSILISIAGCLGLFILILNHKKIIGMGNNND